MASSVIESTAKYFYFSCLDEQVSYAAAQVALTELKNRGWDSESLRHRWVQVFTRNSTRLKQMRGRPWPEFSRGPGFLVPKGLDLGAWAQFLSTGDPNEVQAVLLSRLLQFSEAEIAEGLGVTPGTVRYRVGRGLRHLGGYLES